MVQQLPHAAVGCTSVHVVAAQAPNCVPVPDNSFADCQLFKGVQHKLQANKNINIAIIIIMIIIIITTTTTTTTIK